MTEELIYRLWALFVSGIEIALLYYFLGHLEYCPKIKIKKWQGYAVLFISELIMSSLKIDAEIKLLVLTGLVFILCNLFYSVRLTKASLLTLIYIMLLVVSESMAFAVLKIFNPLLQINTVIEKLVLYIQATILSKSLNFTLLMIINRILSKNRAEYGINEFILMFVPAVANILILIFMINYSYYDVTHDIGTGVDMLIVSFIMAISSVLSVLFFEKFMKNKDTEQRIELMEQQINMQKKYYQDKEIVDNQVKKMYHDMKNHLIAIQQINPESNYDEYLNDINQQIVEYQSYVETGNNMINVLMNEKIMMMNQCDIDYTGVINLKSVDFMKDIDLVTIFGNAVDNAFEACRKITVGNRYIKITTTQIKQFYVMKFKNNMQDQVHIEDNHIITTKKNRKAHGIGLGNIENTVKKYGGSMQIESKNHQFKLIIMIPIQDK